MPRGGDGGNRGRIVTTDVRAEIVRIYGNHFREIFGYCVHRLFTKDLAEDATSAVFLRLVERYPALRTKSGPEIRNWLYGTASNVMAGFLREARRRKEVLAEVARQRQDRLAQGLSCDGELDWPALYEAMSKLDRRQQDILILRYFQGLETSAIAQALGMRHVTVRVRLSRAVKKLKRLLEKSLGGLLRTG
jgi:RNA polymerase sigma-70 factor (ECF subfamily)